MVASLYMAEAGLLAGLELVVRLVLVLVHVLQEVRSQGRRGWMRKIGVDHNSTEVPSLTSCASTLLSEYQRSRDLDQHASPAEISRYCYYGIDVCNCDIYVPGTPPTPPYIFLWKPKESPRPIEGLHWNRHTG